MNLTNNSKIVVIGGAGLIGSHTVDLLIKKKFKELIIYDNFVRGSFSNLNLAKKDKRVKIYNIGGDLLHYDILEKCL